MAKKIDIRKVATPLCSYYESVVHELPYTFTGRLKGITAAGFHALLDRFTFGRLLRTLVKAIQANRKVVKPELCALFKVPTRVYNTALLAAEGMVAGTLECQKLALEDVEYDINRQVVEAFHGPAQELHGRVRKLSRLYKKRQRLLAQQGRPKLHFGKRFYQDQEAKSWKKAYAEARSDRIGCVGSSDELSGNSTYRLRTEFVNGKSRFGIYHSGKLMGYFGLKPQETIELMAILAINNQPFESTKARAKQGPRKGQLVSRKVTTGRIALMVWLIRQDNGHWYAHVSFFQHHAPADYLPKGATGVDLNCRSIARSAVQMIGGKPEVLHHQEHNFEPDWPKQQKQDWVHEQIRAIVLEAKERQFMVVLEYLDFEHCKRWLRTKLGAMLRVMPYRKIRKAFERQCKEQGVILRYVRSNYTSLLGAVLTAYPNLGRDEAAAVVIGLRAIEAGNVWLEEQCQALALQERARLRINRKSKFGCTVTTDGVLIDRQVEECSAKDGTPVDKSTDTHWFQNRAGRAISDLSKAMATYLYQEKWLPVCWKRSGPESDRWHPVVPAGKRTLERSPCSTLSK